MKITLEELPKSIKGHPLLESPQYAAQLAGHSLFFQVMSGLGENPVRVILHDKFSGERKLLVIECEGKLSKAAVEANTPDHAHWKSAEVSESKVKIPVIKPAPLIQKVEIPALPSAGPKVTRSPIISPSPSLAPKVAPAPKLVPSGGSPAPSPSASPKVGSPSPKILSPQIKK